MLEANEIRKSRLGEQQDLPGEGGTGREAGGEALKANQPAAGEGRRAGTP